MSTLIRTVALLVIAGILLGTLFAMQRVESTVQAANQWREPAAFTPPGDSVPPLRDALIASNLFGPPPDDFAATSTPVADATDAAPPGFPDIVATSVIDGEPQVSLRFPDGRIGTYTAGAQLPGDWRIVDVTLNSLRVAQAGEETSIRVFRATDAEAVQSD